MKPRRAQTAIGYQALTTNLAKGSSASLLARPGWHVLVGTFLEHELNVRG
jgi:hypothetical protein